VAGRPQPPRPAAASMGGRGGRQDSSGAPGVTAGPSTSWPPWSTPPVGCWPNVPSTAPRRGARLAGACAGPYPPPRPRPVEIRTLKAVTVRGWGFPHASLLFQVTRKTRDLRSRRWRTVVVYQHRRRAPVPQPRPHRPLATLGIHLAVGILLQLPGDDARAAPDSATSKPTSLAERRAGRKLRSQTSGAHPSPTLPGRAVPEQPDDLDGLLP
jgi:hypothetical protein